MPRGELEDAARSQPEAEEIHRPARYPVALVGVKGEAERAEDLTKKHQQCLRMRESIVTDKEKIIKIDENLKVKFRQLTTKLKIRCHAQWVLEPVRES